MQYKKINVSFNLNGNPTATVQVAENYRIIMERAGILPKIRSTYDKLYNVLVTPMGHISSKDNPTFDARMFTTIKTELLIRAAIKKYANPFLFCILITGSFITGLGVFTTFLSDTGSDYFLITVAMFWSMLLWVMRIIVCGIVLTSVSRTFLGQITIFRPHAEIGWRNGTLFFSLMTEAEHSVNRRALPTEDLQKLAWPLKLIIHDGSDEKYASAIRTADLTHENYITIPNPGIRVGVYRINSVAGHYTRESPPFLNPGDAWEFSSINYGAEGSAHHAKYCQAFAKNIGPWGDQAILEIGLDKGEQRTEAHARAYNKAAFIILFLLMALGASATKTAQITEAIGEHVTDVPQNGARVQYFFKDKTFNRVGDGTSTVLQLLQNGAGFTDDENAGAFMAVEYRGTDGAKIVHALKKTALPSYDPVRPRPFNADMPAKKSFDMPDSVQIALGADQTLAYIHDLKRSLTRKGGIWWYCRIIAWPFISLLFLPGAWFWTISYSAGKETDIRAFYKDFFHRVHEFSAIGCYIVMAIPVLYLDTECFIQFFVESDGGFLGVVAFCAVIYSLAYLFTKFVPNRTGSNTNSRAAGKGQKALPG